MYKVIAGAAGMGHVVLYAEPLRYWWWLAMLFLAVVVVLQRYRRGLKVRAGLGVGVLTWALTVSLWLAIFTGCAAIGTWRLENLVAAQLPTVLDKTKMALTFRIESLQIASPLRTQLSATVVSHADVAGAASLPKPYSLFGKHLRLAWYSPPSDLAVGQQWQAEVVVRRPRGMINPGGFDYGAWLLGQGYQATGYVAATAEATLLAQAAPSLLQLLRTHLQISMSSIASEPAHRFFLALLMGDRQALTADDWQVLQATGTVHLMAISGLHVGLVGLLGFALGAGVVRMALRARWACSARVYRIGPPIVAIAFALGYALLAGFSVPTQRALIAVILVNVLWAIGGRYSRWALLALALLLVSMGETLAWLQSGFWLSFIAVAFLLAKYDGLVGYREVGKRYSRFWRRGILALKVQCLLSIGLCVPLWLLGFPASALSPVANFIAVPLVALFFVPVLLLWIPLSFTPVSELALAVLAWAFNLLWSGLVSLAGLPHALFWPAANIQGMGIVAAVLACAMVLSPATLGMRLGACCLLALLVLGLRPNQTPFELVALDVGQGLAVVVHQPYGALLYDTGAAFSDRFNAGSHIVVPYLRGRGAAPLSVMVSHADADHRGGAAAIFKQLPPDKVWFGEAFPALPHGAIACVAGQRWQYGGADFSVLWPPKRSGGNGVVTLFAAIKNSNNRSCVLLVEYRGKRFLLPGDIDRSVEQHLLKEPSLKDIDVLIAPHHGSKTSSSRVFLEWLRPQHIIVSAGYKNRYGHPHKTVLERYEAIGAAVWTTAQHGAINVTLEGEGIVVKAERLSRPKVWR